MNILAKSLMGATAATALAVAAPAQARDHDRGIDAGDVIAGVLILGGIAAIATAASDDDDRYDDRYNNRRYEPLPPRNGHYGRRGDRQHYGRRGNGQRAIRRCTFAAEQEASRYGRAQVTQITDVDRKRDGWEVEGRVLVNEGHYGRHNDRRYRDRRYRRANYDEGRFTCRIRRGQIDRLRVRGL